MHLFLAACVGVARGMALGNLFHRLTKRAPAFDVSSFAATSWESLRAATAEEDQLTEERLRSGAPHAKALQRGNEPRLVLYRDSAAWCPYCQKVWTLLEETQVSYSVQKINMACYGDKPQSFFDVQPSGTLPAAVVVKDGGATFRSSDAIVAHVLDEYPRGRVDARDDFRWNQLLQLERQHFSAWLQWLGGSDSKKAAFVRVLDAVEDSLATDDGGPYFLGDRFSYLDLAYAPFLERMAASLAYFKGFVVRETPYLKERCEGQDDDGLFAFVRYPALNRWFAAVETRPAYQATAADFYTHAHDLPPQLGGCVSSPSPEAQAVRDDVDGEAWHGREPKYEPVPSWVRDPRAEAAARLADNGPAVARFAARAVAAPGFPPARAELADPNASSDDQLTPLVDALLRLAVLRLRGLEDDASSTQRLAAFLGPDPDNTAAPFAIECLAYLRDRVGVPRDMSFPAALALRSECNALITCLHASVAGGGASSSS